MLVLGGGRFLMGEVPPCTGIQLIDRMLATLSDSRHCHGHAAALAAFIPRVAVKALVLQGLHGREDTVAIMGTIMLLTLSDSRHPYGPTWVPHLQENAPP